MVLKCHLTSRFYHFQLRASKKLTLIDYVLLYLDLESKLCMRSVPKWVCKCSLDEWIRRPPRSTLLQCKLTSRSNHFQLRASKKLTLIDYVLLYLDLESKLCMRSVPKWVCKCRLDE